MRVLVQKSSLYVIEYAVTSSPWRAVRSAGSARGASSLLPSGVPAARGTRRPRETPLATRLPSLFAREKGTEKSEREMRPAALRPRTRPRNAVRSQLAREAAAAAAGQDFEPAAGGPIVSASRQSLCRRGRPRDGETGPSLSKCEGSLSPPPAARAEVIIIIIIIGAAYSRFPMELRLWRTHSWASSKPETVRPTSVEDAN